MTGNIFMPEVIELDSIIIANFADIKNDTPKAIGVKVIRVQYVVIDYQRVLGLA